MQNNYNTQRLYEATELSRSSLYWAKYYRNQNLMLPEAIDLNNLINAHNSLDKSLYSNCVKYWKKVIPDFKESHYTNQWMDNSIAKTFPCQNYTQVGNGVNNAMKDIKYFIAMIDLITENEDIDQNDLDLQHYKNEFTKILKRYKGLCRIYNR